MNRIKIVHLRATSGFGGAENAILTVLGALDTTIFDPHLYVLIQEKTGRALLVEEARKRGIDACCVPYNRRFDLKSLLRLSGYIREQNIHILHAHGYREDIMTSLLSGFTPVKTVSTVHGWTTTPVKKMLDIHSLRFMDHIIAVSNSIAKELENKSIQRERITVLHNPVDTDHFRKASNTTTLRKHLSFNESAYVIGLVGRLTVEKGIRYFVDAAKLVVKQFPLSRFCIIGDGPLKGELQEYARAAGFGSEMVFTGFRSDMVDVFNMLDVLVLSSLSEGLPISILEAMACGVPVVATSVGGVSEVVVEGETGILVSPKDPEAIAEGIARLLSNGALRKHILRNARDHVEKVNSVKAVNAVLSGLYERLVSQD